MPVLNDNAMAGWKDVLDAAAGTAPSSSTAAQTGQALQNGRQVADTVGLLKTGSLTDLLVKKTGVSQTQTEGGAGALFQLAKSKMQAETFAKLEQSVPGMPGMLGAVPAVQQPSALGGLAGRLSSVTGGSAGGLVSLVAAFQQQGMSPEMVRQFIPVVVDYVKNNAGSGLAGALGTALTGR